MAEATRAQGLVSAARRHRGILRRRRPRETLRFLARPLIRQIPELCYDEFPMPAFIKKTLACFFLAIIALAAPAIPTPKPKLILAIAIDQFRYDYLTRFRSEYTGGLNRLLTKG